MVFFMTVVPVELRYLFYACCADLCGFSLYGAVFRLW
ncbi:hypothetical protein Barb6_00367 [Bacteroidales bacterium Barb6]|nr:hypothetical protein Barb6_00367 [Bacteroidales bacterium Barb6]